MSAGIPAAASLPYYTMCGDWKDKYVAIHGPNGHIASGLTHDQAAPIVAELNRLYSLKDTLDN